ncbi:MAG TPA: 2Fe-2S iron-sulfur cluster-binding protein, partial [Gaiellales bacterium]|nr:2Fe-2S iron-sulfur cluster-binding protein [Gaiellales bacterium]
MADRLSPAGGELIDRERAVSFTWEGRAVRGLAGDTVASALYAEGVRVFSRSFKYHRSRGLMCCSGECPNCLVQVDGVPAVRACMTPIAEGMSVAHINAWPSLERDLLHLVGRATPGFGMQVGFYYKTFIRPRWAWKYYERILRGAAGLGRLDPEHRRSRRFEKVHRHVDVLVLGGGRAGLEAAVAAARGGDDVALVDEGLALGGSLAFGGHDAAAQAAALADDARDAGVLILQPAYAAGVYEGLLVPVFQGDTMHRFRAGRLVIATGGIEQPLVFSQNDLPGIMLGGAARRLVNQFRVAPGDEVVVVCSDDEGVDAACDLAEAGIHVAAVADSRPAGEDDERLALRRIEHLRGFRPVQARGRTHVTGVVVERGGERRTLSCDTLVVSGGRVAHTALLTQAGGSIRFDRERRMYVPDRLPENVTVASQPAVPAAAVPAAAPAGVKGKQFVCLCEDVTTKDMHLSLQEGFTSLELSKRYTTV